MSRVPWIALVLSLPSFGSSKRSTTLLLPPRGRMHAMSLAGACMWPLVDEQAMGARGHPATARPTPATSRQPRPAASAHVEPGRRPRPSTTAHGRAAPTTATTTDRPHQSTTCVLARQARYTLGRRHELRSHGTRPRATASTSTPPGAKTSHASPGRLRFLRPAGSGCGGGKQPPPLLLPGRPAGSKQQQARVHAGRVAMSAGRPGRRTGSGHRSFSGTPSTTGNGIVAVCSNFVVCLKSGTRQRPLLPCATIEAHGKVATHGKQLLCRC